MLKQLTIKIPVELHEEIKIIAVKNGITLQALVWAALHKYLKEDYESKKNGNEG